ncbi:IS5 family transposase [Streptomyces sp. NBC_01343]|uniref:IS5 family transposase n=1 Tax=Streptomyces sp. NBC_01343 TaxID=2903832 RepID=UPI002E12A9E9|nr:IS5 family transposase [Streptomyces sp. NBC_01343]
MTDAEWAAVRPLLPVPAWLEGRGGQPEGYCHRQMLDAIRYLVAGGISWRSMPVDFPAWARVYAFFRRWRENELIAEFHDRLRENVRKREGREAEPSAGIIDAQSVKAAASVPAASRGYDGGKQVNGRKRHVITDCLGLILVVAVTAANIGGREAALPLLARLRNLHRDITLVWADGGYTGGLIDWRREKLARRGWGAGRPGHEPPAGAEHPRCLQEQPATRASTSSSRAITRRSGSTSAASSASAANAAASRSSSARTRAAASRSSSKPSGTYARPTVEGGPLSLPALTSSPRARRRVRRGRPGAAVVRWRRPCRGQQPPQL